MYIQKYIYLDVKSYSKYVCDIMQCLGKLGRNMHSKKTWNRAVRHRQVVVIKVLRPCKLEGRLHSFTRVMAMARPRLYMALVISVVDPPCTLGSSPNGTVWRNKLFCLSLREVIRAHTDATRWVRPSKQWVAWITDTCGQRPCAFRRLDLKKNLHRQKQE